MSTDKSGVYSRLQFILSISHSLDAHTDAFHTTLQDDSDEVEEQDVSQHPDSVPSGAPPLPPRPSPQPQHLPIHLRSM